MPPVRSLTTLPMPMPWMAITAPAVPSTILSTVPATPPSGAYVVSDAQHDQHSHYDYDSVGRITSEYRAYGRTEQVTQSYAYDALGQVLRQGIGDASQMHYSYYAYDAAGRTTRSIDAQGYVVETVYTAHGQVDNQITYMNPVALPITDEPNWANKALTDPAYGHTLNTDPVSGDRTVRFSYDANGQIDTETDAFGSVSRYRYDAHGNLITTVQAEGQAEQREIHRSYNALGQVIEETFAYGEPEQSSTRYRYDTFGNQIEVLDARGVELAEGNSDWAKAERLRLGYTVIDVDTSQTRAKRASELSPAEQEQLKALYTTLQDFDQLGRKLSATDPLGGTTTTGYDAFGNIVSTTDPNGHSGYFYYDVLNRVQLQIDPEGYAITTTRDRFGNATQTLNYANKVQGSYDANSAIALVSITPNPVTGPYLLTDANKDQRTLADYDALGRNTRITDAEGYTESFTYDALGYVIAHQDKNGHALIGSNESHYLQQRKALGYVDANGEALLVAALTAEQKNALLALHTTSYTYDANGNKITETLPITSDDWHRRPSPSHQPV